MSHRIGLLALALCSCSGKPDPVTIVNAIPPPCYGAAVELVAISSSALSCQPDGGVCDLKAMRNDAVDALAECIKAAP